MLMDFLELWLMFWGVFVITDVKLMKGDTLLSRGIFNLPIAAVPAATIIAIVQIVGGLT